MFTQIIKFIRLLGSETEPFQISMAFGLAMFIGFTPLFSAHNLLIIFLLLVLRINIAAFILATVVFSGFAYLLDPLFNQVGHSILMSPGLKETFTEMYNSSWWRVTHFNNTVVMGGFVVSLVALIPMVIVFNIIINRYRKHFIQYVKNSKLFKFMQNSKIFARLVSVAN